MLTDSASRADGQQSLTIALHSSCRAAQFQTAPSGDDGQTLAAPLHRDPRGGPADSARRARPHGQKRPQTTSRELGAVLATVHTYRTNCSTFTSECITAEHQWRDNRTATGAKRKWPRCCWTSVRNADYFMNAIAHFRHSRTTLKRKKKRSCANHPVWPN